MNIIAAVDKNWAIGKNNELLVRIPMDQKFFRETTTGKVVVMGRKTLESFPNGLPLKNRTNIVLTHNPAYQVKDAIVVHSMEELHRELEKELITRKQHPAPKFWLNPEIKDFYQFTPDDIKVTDYVTGPQIKNIPVAI